MGVTEDERAVVLAIAEAWNRFIDLPVEHEDDREDFRRAIHVANAIVLKRSGRRQMRETT